MNRLLVTTSKIEQMVNITMAVQDLVRAGGFTDGILKLFCPHTTAAITCTEGHDPAVGLDFLGTMDTTVPAHQLWQHPGNGAGHVKAAMIGPNVEIFVERGQLMLGSWQGIFFCEFDGPRPREVWVKWISD